MLCTRYNKWQRPYFHLNHFQIWILLLTVGLRANFSLGLCFPILNKKDILTKLSTEELMLSDCGVGEDSWESLDCKEIQPVRPKGDQSWIFIGRTDAEAQTAILWPPDAKNWLIGKDPDTGKDCRQKEKGMTEDEMVGWHHQLHGHEFEQSPGDRDGQRSLACLSPWVHRVGHDWETELIDLCLKNLPVLSF